MNKLLISVSSISDLSIEAYGYVLGYEKYTLFASSYFSYEEIKNIKDKNIYILLNALIHEKDLEDAKKEVDKLIPLGVNFIVQDVGLLTYLLSNIDNSKVSFFPYTLICNKEELLAYHDNFNVSVNISNELTLEEMKDVLSVGGGIVNLFGYTPIYQSYRKILSLYENEKTLSLDKSSLYLKENTREDLFPVNENKYGSVIFRSHPNSYLEDYEFIKEAEYLFIDSFKVDHDLFVKVVELSNKLIKGEINRNDILKIYDDMSFISKDGFKYKKTVLRK